MTLSNADLREALLALHREYKYSPQDLYLDKLAALFQAREQQLLTELLGELPEKYDGGVTFKKPDDKQILEDGKTIGRNEVIDHVVKTIEHYREGL